jgi:hypothetical protein
MNFRDTLSSILSLIPSHKRNTRHYSWSHHHWQRLDPYRHHPRPPKSQLDTCSMRRIHFRATQNSPVLRNRIHTRRPHFVPTPLSDIRSESRSCWQSNTGTIDRYDRRNTRFRLWQSKSARDCCTSPKWSYTRGRSRKRERVRSRESALLEADKTSKERHCKNRKPSIGKY